MSSNRNSAVREIKSRLNILDIVRRYVELSRAGNRWVAPCPFHSETKPSFSVNEEEGFFYCFGCQAKGDIFEFYSRVNGLDFREALEQLAEEAGVTLSDVKADPRAEAERNFKKTALAMHELASQHFQKNLVAESGSLARKYLYDRKISSEIIEQFELGWSLAEWQGLSNALKRAGYTQKQGVDSGLLAASDRGSAYDRFRGRLIFPIKNLSGQVIAFGGRIIGDEDAAKYINSSDSPIYKKGDNLYGLFQARRGISAKKSVILTEGYIDVLTLHQFGYNNACGALGTAFTDEQVRRLAGFCSNFELIFDGDAPGRKAALRACEMILTKGLRCQVVLLPDKEDIDSLLQEKGQDAFEALRVKSPDGLDFCIRMLLADFAPKDIVDWVNDFTRKIERPELLSKYISRLAHAFELDEAEIRLAVSKQVRAGSRPQTGIDASLQANASAKVKTLDREIMSFLVRYPHTLPQLRDAGALFVLSEKWALSLWEKMALCAPEYDPSDVLYNLDDKEKEFWGKYRVMSAPPVENQQSELEDVCQFIAKMCVERQDTACLRALRQQTSTNDDDLELLKALNESLVQKRTLGSSDG